MFQLMLPEVVSLQPAVNSWVMFYFSWSSDIIRAQRLSLYTAVNCEARGEIAIAFR
jgi:hypothetical protein